MKKVKNTPLGPRQARAMASEAHVCLLDGIMQSSECVVEDLVFQGGTSLALAYNSPRFSEDLDFISSEELNIPNIMAKATRHAEALFRQNHPGATLTLKERSSVDNPNRMFTVSVALPNVLGVVKVKTEFWRTSKENVRGYDGSYRSLSHRGQLSTLLPVASTRQIFTDKVLALGARERLKWRDIFDLWFLSTQPDPPSVDAGFSKSMTETVRMYDTAPDRVVDQWRRLAAASVEELLALAETDLKPWLPTDVWARLHPDTTRLMVEGMQKTLASAAESWTIPSVPRTAP